MASKTASERQESRSFSEMKWLRYVQEAKIPAGDAFQDYRVALRKEPIERSQIPKYNDILLEGMRIAKRSRSGAAASARYSYVNPEETIVVEEQEFAFGSPKHIPNSRFLVTYDIDTCLAVVAYNPKQNAGFMAHAFEPVNAVDAIEKAVELLDAETVVLFGGRSNNDISLETVCAAEGLLASHGKVKIAGRDTFRNNRTTCIGIDTMTGEILFPSNQPAFTGINCYPLRANLTLIHSSGRHEFCLSDRVMPVASTISDNLDRARR